MFHPQTGRLVEQATYEGARVECMRVGVFRCDFQEKFQLEPMAFQQLIDEVHKKKCLKTDESPQTPRGDEIRKYCLKFVTCSEVDE